MPNGQSAALSGVRRPTVSVIMPVYNDGHYVRYAIESILKQTFRDFEFLIVDDGCTDNTQQMIAAYPDPRIRMLVNERNLGLAPSLNRGIVAARGQYIARQDADDISLPARLEAQVRFLEDYPETGLVGANAFYMDADGNVAGDFNSPCCDIDLKWAMLFRNPFIHSTMMLRKSVLDRVGVYTSDPELFRAFVEDYDLWWRISRVCRVANLEDRLLKWRTNPTSSSIRTNGEQARQAERIAQRNICAVLGWEALDPKIWDGIQRLRFHPPSEPLNLDTEEARRTLSFLRQLHDGFCRVYGFDKQTRDAHRKRTFWFWGKHAVALSYRRNGRRDLACRLALLRSGADLLVRARWPGAVPHIRPEPAT
ncbi:MAG TPA: glycosyltransferase [Terriglobales bacterium]|nr:glycosyltransferase [Terriglobales bacterium]